MEENIKQYLRNLYENYKYEITAFTSNTYKAKYLGAMEATLVILGKLKPGHPFDYEKHIISFRLLWLFPIKFSIKESYTHLILRLTKETISK